MILILLIILLVNFIMTPKTDCQKCGFKINNTLYSIDEFMDIYYKECINAEPVMDTSKVKIQEG